MAVSENIKQVIKSYKSWFFLENNLILHRFLERNLPNKIVFFELFVCDGITMLKHNGISRIKKTAEKMKIRSV